MYPVGAERLYNGYVEVKVSRSEWRWKHHLIWEQAHGVVPEGHMVCFADGDNRNFSLDNLAAVSRADFANDRIHNARRAKFPIGSEKLDSYGYIQVKVAEPKKWRLKHHLIWEMAHDPIPGNHNVYFIDGDKRNFRLDNLAVRPKTPPIGTEQVTHGDYVRVKVAAPDTWRWKHHLIWEAANGPIPEGHSVCFADRSPQNFALANLVLVSNPVRGYMIHKNLFKGAIEPELFQTAVNVATLGLAINRIRRETASQLV
jgi:hypothetical protein